MAATLFFGLIVTTSIPRAAPMVVFISMAIAVVAVAACA